MRRREFLALVGGATAAWPFAARTQQSTLPVIGFLGTETSDLFANRLRAFKNGLGEIGYVEGENVAIEYRWGEGHNGRLPALASDLVRRQVSAIGANGPAAVAAKGADDNPDHLFQRRRPSRARACRQLEPTRKEPHGR